MWSISFGLDLIFLMDNSVQHLFMCLMAISIVSLEKYSKVCCFYIIYLFIYFWLYSLLLHRLFSSCRQQGYILVAECELLLAVFSCCGAWALGHVGFSSLASGFRSCGSWAPQHGLSSALQHVGSTQTRDWIHGSSILWMHPRLLNSPANSLPLSHQWSPSVFKMSLLSSLPFYCSVAGVLLMYFGVEGYTRPLSNTCIYVQIFSPILCVVCLLFFIISFHTQKFLIVYSVYFFFHYLRF